MTRVLDYADLAKSVLPSCIALEYTLLALRLIFVAVFVTKAENCGLKGRALG